MDKIIAFSNRTEARDKFTKVIQYASKLISWGLIGVDRSYQKRFYELYVMARDSRKIFRLFKSIQEIKNINDKLKDLLWKKEKIPILLEILSRMGYLIYWVFDNCVILAAVKILKTENNSFISYTAHLGWVIGLCWGILKNLYEIFSLLRRGKENNKKDDMIIINEGEQINVWHEILKNLIEMIGRIGDLIPATSGIDLPQKIFKYKFSEGFQGFGGLLSSIISIWVLWNKLD